MKKALADIQRKDQSFDSRIKVVGRAAHLTERKENIKPAGTNNSQIPTASSLNLILPSSTLLDNS
jgi:hypothetical protein